MSIYGPYQFDFCMKYFNACYRDSLSHSRNVSSTESTNSIIVSNLCFSNHHNTADVKKIKMANKTSKFSQIIRNIFGMKKKVKKKYKHLEDEPVNQVEDPKYLDDVMYKLFDRILYDNSQVSQEKFEGQEVNLKENVNRYTTSKVFNTAWKGFTEEPLYVDATTEMDQRVATRHRLKTRKKKLQKNVGVWSWPGALSAFDPVPELQFARESRLLTVNEARGVVVPDGKPVTALMTPSTQGDTRGNSLLEQHHCQVLLLLSTGCQEMDHQHRQPSPSSPIPITVRHIDRGSSVTEPSRFVSSFYHKVGNHALPEPNTNPKINKTPLIKKVKKHKSAPKTPVPNGPVNLKPRREKMNARRTPTINIEEIETNTLPDDDYKFDAGISSITNAASVDTAVLTTVSRGRRISHKKTAEPLPEAKGAAYKKPRKTMLVKDIEYNENDALTPIINEHLDILRDSSPSLISGKRKSHMINMALAVGVDEQEIAYWSGDDEGISDDADEEMEADDEENDDTFIGSSPVFTTSKRGKQYLKILLQSHSRLRNFPFTRGPKVPPPEEMGLSRQQVTEKYQVRHQTRRRHFNSRHRDNANIASVSAFVTSEGINTYHNHHLQRVSGSISNSVMGIPDRNISIRTVSTHLRSHAAAPMRGDGISSSHQSSSTHSPDPLSSENITYPITLPRYYHRNLESPAGHSPLLSARRHHKRTWNTNNPKSMEVLVLTTPQPPCPASPQSPQTPNISYLVSYSNTIADSPLSPIPNLQHNSLPILNRLSTNQVSTGLSFVDSDPSSQQDVQYSNAHISPPKHTPRSYISMNNQSAYRSLVETKPSNPQITNHLNSGYMPTNHISSNMSLVGVAPTIYQSTNQPVVASSPNHTIPMPQPKMNVSKKLGCVDLWRNYIENLITNDNTTSSSTVTFIDRSDGITNHPIISPVWPEKLTNHNQANDRPHYNTSINIIKYRLSQLSFKEHQHSLMSMFNVFFDYSTDFQTDKFSI